MPASPRTSTTRPPSRARASSSRSRASSASRPTNGTGRGLGAGSGVRADGGAAAVAVVPALTASYSAVVSCSGGTPSSRDRVRTHSRYWCRAPARSPVPASSRIVAWWAGSCSGSSASHRRATRSAAGQVAGGLPVRRQPGQDGHELLPDRVRLALHPGLEPGCVPHHEALEQLAAGGLRGLLEPALRGQPAEPQHVDVEPGRQRHLVATGHEGVRAEGRAECGQRATQRAARVREVLVGPQQVGDGVARAGVLRQRQQREHGHRLAGVEAHGRAVALHARRPQQPDPDHCPPRHGRSPAAAGRHDALP